MKTDNGTRAAKRKRAVPVPRRGTAEVVYELADWLKQRPSLNARVVGRHGPPGLAAAARREFGGVGEALCYARVFLEQQQPPRPRCDAADRGPSSTNRGVGSAPNTRNNEEHMAAVESEPSVAISTLAHVVNNALVPARYHLEQLQKAHESGEQRDRIDTALRGITTVLKFVDDLVHGGKE